MSLMTKSQKATITKEWNKTGTDMGCPCKNKQKQQAASASKTPQRPTSPLKNGNIGTSRITRRVIR